jgi:hypothetical protein
MGSSSGQALTTASCHSGQCRIQRIARRRPNQQRQRVAESAEIWRAHHNVLDVFLTRGRPLPLGHPRRKLSQLCRYRDGGSTWLQINDSAHQCGVFTAICKDIRTFGVGYRGTGGRIELSGGLVRTSHAGLESRAARCRFGCSCESTRQRLQSRQPII